jgi:hypothetical protein
MQTTPIDPVGATWRSPEKSVGIQEFLFDFFLAASSA